MILEGIVTTTATDGTVNIAPMGPRVQADMRVFQLRPFRTAHTFANLKAHPEGVLHVVDDVLLLARSAVGVPDPMPFLAPAARINGWVLADACRWYEFRVVACDESAERVTLTAESVHVGRGRDFFGFNRAKHAVIEAAILATRVHLLPAAEIAAEFRRLAILVDKTGGPREHEAFQFLQNYVFSFRHPSTAEGRPP